MNKSRKELASQAQAIEDIFAGPPRFPRFVETPFGTGRVGPYAYHEASAVLAGEKPVSIFSEKHMPENLLDVLMSAVEEGFLSFKKVWDKSGHLSGHCYYFYQPENEEDVNELVIMEQRADHQRRYSYPKENGCYGYTVWDEIRIGEILGYTKADIAAFLEHVGYSSELYLDSARREEAEREQARMDNVTPKKSSSVLSSRSP